MSVRKGGQVIAEVADLSNYALNSNVVHQTGTDDNIQGTKRFKTTIYVDNAGGYYQKATNITSSTATPSSTQSAYPINVYDNSGNQFAQLKVNVDANNSIGFMIKSKDNNWKTGLFCYGTSNGITTYAPTPTADDNSTKIATTNFVRTFLSDYYRHGYRCPKFDVLCDSVISSGNITLAHPYTDYDFLMISGANDSNSNIHTILVPSFIISKARSWGAQWTLWHNANGNYWYLNPTSTETTFIVGAENSIIKEIVGISFVS